MLVIGQLFASIISGESKLFLRGAPKLVAKGGLSLRCKDRVIAIRNDIDPEVVITWHRSEFNIRDVSTPLDMTETPGRFPRSPS